MWRALRHRDFAWPGLGSDRQRHRRGHGLVEPAVGDDLRDLLLRRAPGEGPRRRAGPEQGCVSRKRPAPGVKTAIAGRLLNV